MYKKNKIEVYTKKECVQYNSILAARRLFTKHTLNRHSVALIRPSGYNVEVTFNNPISDEVTVREFSDYTKVYKYLNEVF